MSSEMTEENIGKMKSLMIDLMRQIDNPFLSVVEETCTMLDHPIDEDDNHHRCFCREKIYVQIDN
jgi:hypothetical protein